MIWLLDKNLLQNRASLPLVRIALVGGRRGALQGEGIENGRLSVIGVARLKLLHRFFISQRAGMMVQLVGILVEDLDGADVVPLALGFRRS
jgi:hypothetical protein